MSAKYLKRRAGTTLYIWKSRYLKKRPIMIVLASLLIVSLIFPVAILFILRASYYQAFDTNLTKLKDAQQVLVLAPEEPGLQEDALRTIQELKTRGLLESLSIINIFTEKGEQITKMAALLDTTQESVGAMKVSYQKTNLADVCKGLKSGDNVLIIGPAYHLTSAVHACVSMGLTVHAQEYYSSGVNVLNAAWGLLGTIWQVQISQGN